MGLESAGLDRFADAADLLRGGVFSHDHEHVIALLSGRPL
jgi:hypothetical protein